MVQTDSPNQRLSDGDGPSQASSARRAEILRRAAAVFRRKGFHGAGMREIAAGLEMTPGSLYYYFRSKEDLLYACQQISLTRLIESAERILSEDAPADECLRALIAAHLDLTLDELGGSAAHVEFHALPEPLLAEIVEMRDTYEQSIRQLIQRGVEEGTFRSVDVKLATMALLGALNWSVVWYKPEGRWSSPDLVASFADLFVDGLKNSPIENAAPQEPPTKGTEA